MLARAIGNLNENQIISAKFALRRAHAGGRKYEC